MQPLTKKYTVNIPSRRIAVSIDQLINQQEELNENQIFYINFRFYCDMFLVILMIVIIIGFIMELCGLNK